ncbi:MAG: hypothetical protein FJ049_02975 [Cyanobacteria bacterium M_surface_7_m2_037]|nr:hypothetical protein [Cyanobacteria bacterium K_DeepCast_0m_m1_088]MBM5795074.1 hypothetical protein [Cyanobacteria bacterium M_surface_7_m2_037]MBM5819059.1 hypothetical protein [Cyanobacteria bacterium K_DeepCast_150m_m2_101]
MRSVRLNGWGAFQQSWAGLGRQPLLLVFSLSALGTHLLGWALFAAADAVDSGVLAALLHLSGLALYGGSLIWMIEGFTLAGLAIAREQSIHWHELSPAECRHSGRLCIYLMWLAGALAAVALITGVIWSLALLLLPGLSAVPALLGLIAAAAVVISQLFGPCLVLDTRLKGMALFRQGVWLLEHHGPGLLLLCCGLIALLGVPVLIGLLAEGLVSGGGPLVTALALVVVLPLITTTVTSAYVQLRPELQHAASA